ncbi:MAG TPA: XRE family transcriptional regulator [Alphaproteobacteria bacterium]
MADPREQVIRATLVERMAKIIKRQGYTERHLEQVLRASPDRAKAIHGGQLDQFSTDELRRMITVLE